MMRGGGVVGSEWPPNGCAYLYPPLPPGALLSLRSPAAAARTFYFDYYSHTVLATAAVPM
jgi:hypothetical protein